MYRVLENLNSTCLRIVPALLMGPILLVGSAASQEKPQNNVTYEDDIQPIFLQRCSSCHNGQQREGDLDLTNYTSTMEGGGSGSVIAPQDAAGSYLFSLITHAESPEMPPNGDKIPDSEIELISKWIDFGALESKGSKALKPKAELDIALSESPLARPAVVPMPLRMPVEPVIKTRRPSVIAIATSPWAPVAAVSAPKQILLYNTQTLELVGVLPMQEGLAHSLRFSRNGQLLLAGGGQDGASGEAILWNLVTGQHVTSVGDELETVLAADINPNHELIALGGPKKIVKVYSVADGNLIAEIGKHTDWITAIEFSPCGKFLATGDRNGGLYIWEPDTGNEIYTLKGHTKSITAISWRVDGRIVASASEDSTLRIWEMKKGAQVKSWAAHREGVMSIEFQRDGKIASCGRDKIAKVWDQGGKLIRKFGGLSDLAVAVSYCDETKRILAGDWTGQLRVWNAEDGVHLGNLAANPPRLAERLKTAQQALVVAQAKYALLADQATRTQLSLDGIANSLEQVKQIRRIIQANLTETESQFAAAKQQFESTRGQHVQWRNELEEKRKAQPLIRESLDNAVAASTSLPGDPDLKATVASLDEKAKQIDARIAELTGLVAKSNQDKDTTKSQMVDAAMAVESTNSELQIAIAEVVKLQGEFGRIQEKLKNETEVASAAHAEVAKAAKLVERWTNEMAFVSELKSLEQKLEATQLAVAEKQAVVDAANQQMAEAQKLVDAADEHKSAVQEQIDAIKQQIQQLRLAQ